jgi:hypothetical protein
MNSDPSKVVVSGEGTKMGILRTEIKVLIDTRKAGPGELTAYCIGPQKAATCEFFDHKDGTFTLFIKPQEIGIHVLQIKYNDEHVPESPFIICISESQEGCRNLGIENGITYETNTNSLFEVNGMGLLEAKVNQESDFIIDGSRAGELNGLPEIKLTGNSCDIEVKIMQMGHNIYRCSYIPHAPGI